MSKTRFTPKKTHIAKGSSIALCATIATVFLPANQVFAADKNVQSLDSVAISSQKTRATPESSATKLSLTARETPQTVTTITSEKMQEQNLTDIDMVLRQATGISASLYDTQRPLYYARGFVIEDFQVDGIPSFSSSANREFDMALYERVDVISGANGLLTGTGKPSATINLIRKRPQRTFSANASLSLGQHSLRRGQIDLNVPITENGNVRGRLVIAPQYKQSFRNRYSEKKMAALAAIEADIGSASVVSLGFTHQNSDPKAPIWGTIPRYNSDGTLANLPTSTSFSPSWTRWKRQTNTFYATVEHQLNNQFLLKAAWQHTEHKNFRLATYASSLAGASSFTPFINADGSGVRLLAGLGGGKQKSDAFDVYLSGKFELGGREHDVTAGFSHDKNKSTSDSYTSVSSWSYIINNIHTWDGTADAPTYSKTGAWRDTTTSKNSFYTSARFKLTDNLSAIAGARFTKYKTYRDAYSTQGVYTQTDSRLSAKKTIPYIGLVYDITPEVAAYASYTQIFSPQSYKDKNNNPLSPVVGSNAEAGLKILVPEMKMQANIAVFKTKQNNYGVVDSTQLPNSLPDGSTPYVGVNGTKVSGIEMSANAQPLDGLNVNAGLTYLKTKRNATDLLWANFPELQIKASADYKFQTPQLSGFSVGADLIWTGKTDAFNVPHPTLGTTDVTEKAYTLLNLRANYDFNKSTSLGLYIQNATNKKYWANLDYANYGDTRQINVVLRHKF